MTQDAQFYSVYIARDAIEVRDIDDSGDGYARLVCSQANYQNALNFARRLAHNKKLPLNNLAAASVKPSSEVSDGFYR